MNSKLIKKIDERLAVLSGLSEQEFSEEAQKMKEYKNKASIKKNIVKIISVAVEAMIRALKASKYDNQIEAALALFENNVVELSHGEGKTFAIIIASYLKFLAGNKVHVMTENDFLLQRDFNRARSVFKLLDIKVGAIPSKKAFDYEMINKKESYNCDIVYIHSIEAIFDYLKSEDKSYLDKTSIIIDDIDRIVNTPEPVSAVLISPETSETENLSVIDYIKKYTTISGIADFAIKDKNFYKKYLKKSTVKINDNKQNKLIKLTDVLSKTREEKIKKIIDEVIEVHKYRCPVLIAVSEPEDMYLITKELDKKGVYYTKVTNQNDTMDIFNTSVAGELNKVTIISSPTGVDIPLGGDPYYQALNELNLRGLEKESDKYIEQWQPVYNTKFFLAQKNSEEIRKLGGIYTIISSHSDNDDIFKSFCARRGEPGSVKFFTSTEDNFYKNIDMKKLFAITNSLNIDDKKIINNKYISKVIVNYARYINELKREIKK